MNRKALAVTLLLAALSFAGPLETHAQSSTPAEGGPQSPTTSAPAGPFSFRAGQAVYIVAFRRSQQTLATLPDATQTVVTRPTDYPISDLDAEREVRKELEKWRFFNVVDKPSSADFILIVNVEGGSIEALAVPPDAYREHYKDAFDLDELREAAHGRYAAGPLKLPTLGRLTDRLVKDFRMKVEKARAQLR
jgi:hypothetical protein